MIAIDGKTVRRSHDQARGKEAIHMVSAWASVNGLVLGQRKVETKSNEITAILELLHLLDVSGCLVTIDAMGCQKKIVQAIRDGKADYLLRVKDNQAGLHQDIEDWFVHGDQQRFAQMKLNYAETVNKNNGRIEIRRCWAIADPVAVEYIRHYEGWTDLQTIVRIQRETTITEALPVRRLTTSAVSPTMQRDFWMPPAITGQLKTASIGCSMSPFERMTPASALATVHRIWLSCAI